jgi:phosphopantetheinyl transferase
LPLVYQHTVNDSTKIGIWHILEQDDFFRERVLQATHVSHPHKRLQHLAGRYLLTCLFPDFPLTDILIADTLKPFLENEKYHFSISHSGDFAAAMVSRTNRVGIDIECITARIERVQHRFLADREKAFLLAAASREYEPAPGDFAWQSWLTLAWCAKEALFKWDGEGLMDFREHMQVAAVPVLYSPGAYRLRFDLPGRRTSPLSVSGRSFPEFMLAWVTTAAAKPFQ